MQTVQHSQRFLQQRRMFLLLPLILFPFLTLLFWALGGGKANHADAPADSAGKGLNIYLPDAKLKSDKGFNKLSFYEQAAKDSTRMLEKSRTDPYSNQFRAAGLDTSLSSSDNDNRGQHIISPETNSLAFHNDNNSGVDANEAKVYSKLEQLNKAVEQSRAAATQRQQTSHSNAPDYRSSSSNRDVERLEAMMRRMKEDKEEDPDIRQLNEMLDKIAAIQHPEQVQDTVLPSYLNKRAQQSLKVKKKRTDITVSTLQSKQTTVNHSSKAEISPVSFYNDNNSSADPDTMEANTIQALISKTQTLISGATVKLSLLQDITVQGSEIPKGSFLYGTASISNERLLIKISSLRLGNIVLPISLDCYDMDGLEGIYVPGSISRDAVKQSADKAAKGIGITTFNPSIGAQAASAGIETAKSLFSKKVRLVKVAIPAGYLVLLKDSHQK